MGILQKALDEIKYRVPFNILTAAFNNYNEEGWRQAPVSLDELILSKVIRPRVIFDANIVGGETLTVPVYNLNVEYADDFTRVVKIPSEHINYRTIMSVLSAHYMPYGYNYNNTSAAMAGAGTSGVNDITNTAQRVNNSFSSVPVLSTAIVRLVGHNTVMIHDKMYITNVHSVRCVVANEENMENIPPRSWHAFSKLCELAVKSFIHNILVIRMGNSYLVGGQELGVFKDIVDSYSDSEELYQVELRERWQKINIYFSDGIEHTKYMRMLINPGI
jgi:hypothetical protein